MLKINIKVEGYIVIDETKTTSTDIDDIIRNINKLINIDDVNIKLGERYK